MCFASEHLSINWPFLPLKSIQINELSQTEGNLSSFPLQVGHYDCRFAALIFQYCKIKVTRWVLI